MPTCHSCGLKRVTNQQKVRWVSFWLDESGDPAMIRHMCGDCAILLGYCLGCGAILCPNVDKVKFKRWCPACQNKAHDWSEKELKRFLGTAELAKDYRDMRRPPS